MINWGDSKPCHTTTPRMLNVRSVPWDLRDILTASLVLVVGMLILIIALIPISRYGGLTSAPLVCIGLAMTSVMLLAVSWFFGPRKHHVSITSWGIRQPLVSSMSAFTLPVVILVVILTFNALYGWVTSELGWDILEPSNAFLDADYGPYSLTIIGILVILIGPFAEEVFFRGFFLPGIAQSWGPKAGIITSALLFSLAHGEIALMIPISVAGLLLGWLYVRTDSLVMSFIVHSLQNTVAFGVTIIT